MAVSRISSASAQTTSASITTPTAGDLIVVFAHRDGSTTAPSLATGYTSFYTATGANTNSHRVGFKFSDGTETNTGTWTNATSVVCTVFRGATLGGSAGASGGANSSTIAYNTFTLNRQDSTSWVMGASGHRTATNNTSAPTNMTNRTNAVDCCGNDTNGTTNTWNTQTVSVNATSGWRSHTFEIRSQHCGTQTQAGTGTWSSSMSYEAGGLKYTYTGAVAQTNTWQGTLRLPVMLALSSNFADGDATTYQLTAPSGKSTTDFDAGKMGESSNPLTITIGADDYTEIEFCITVDGAASDAFNLRITENGTPFLTYSQTPTYTITSGLDYSYTGAIASTDSWSHVRNIERVVTGAISATGFSVASRNVEKCVIGSIAATGTPVSVMTHEKIITGTVAQIDTWSSESYYTQASVNYVHTGAVAAVDTWASERSVDIYKATLISSVDTWSHNRYVDITRTSDLAQTDTWSGVRTVEVLRTGTLAQIDTWVAGVYGGLKDYTHVGAVAQINTWESPHPAEVLKPSTLSQTNTWMAEEYHERPLVTGAIAATGTWVSTRTTEYLISALVDSTDTWSHFRNVEKQYVGTTASVWEWQSEFEYNLLKFVHEGAVAGDYTWNSGIGLYRIFTGAISRENTWISEKMQDITRTGAISSIDTWSHVRNIERVMEGAIYSTETWSHIRNIGMVYVGTFNHQDVWVSQKGFQKIIHGTISAEEFWQALSWKLEWVLPDDVFVVPARDAVGYVAGRDSNASAPAREATALAGTRDSNATYSS